MRRGRPMVRIIVAALLLAGLTTLAGKASAQPQLALVSIDAGSLRSSLQDRQSQTGIELLFDPDIVAGLHSPAVQGNLTAEQALQRLTAQSGLTIRRAASGAWIIERLDAPPLEQPDIPVPEILVIGRLSQN